MENLPYKSVPYSQASPTQQAQALALIQERFQPRFSTLTPTQWNKAMVACYPILEADETSVELREDDMARLATYLVLWHSRPDSPEQIAYCSASRHVAHKLTGFSRRAVMALAQAAALPAEDRHETLDLYRCALETMTGGDAVANNITSAFAFRATEPSRVRFAYPQPTSCTGSAAAVLPAKRPSSRAIKELPDQWDHMQRWFKRTNEPARPWNVSAISRQLNINQSVVRALLTAPKGAPGTSRVAFSRVRLRLLQKYFAPHGYQVLG